MIAWETANRGSKLIAGLPGLPDVDFAGDCGRDECGTELLEKVDGVTNLGNHVINARCLPVEESSDGRLFSCVRKWHAIVSQLDSGEVIYGVRIPSGREDPVPRQCIH